MNRRPRSLLPAQQQEVLPAAGPPVSPQPREPALFSCWGRTESRRPWWKCRMRRCRGGWSSSGWPWKPA
eukprot:7202285-Pyramimonas_sp.AAC.1